MPYYSFKESLNFFSEKLNCSPPQEDLDQEEVELMVDHLHVILAKSTQEGSMHMQTTLGYLIQPLSEEHLKEIATSNFLGINTGGCKISFDKTGVSLCLHAYTTCGATPQDNWEWLHRLLCVAREWIKILELWKEFIPLSTLNIEDKKNAPDSPNRPKN